MRSRDLADVRLIDSSGRQVPFIVERRDEPLVIELDAVRQGLADPQDCALPIPGWILADPSAWALVPLKHQQRMTGVVVLATPEYRRPLDWEDFDLLRTAGRQAASSLAEAQGQRALSDAQRFEEFNRRFAFILHDIKNLASQLSLLTRNAERHAENAEFRADMIATLQSSVGKMNDLLARLAPQAGARPHRHQPRLDDRSAHVGRLRKNIRAERRARQVIARAPDWCSLSATPRH